MTAKRDELLAHDADGIREFDNALPRWWLYGFYFTIGFAIVYFANYHILSTPVFGRATLTAEYADDVKRAAASQPRPAPGASMAVVALTDAHGLEEGKEIFEGPTNVCFSCHRADLGGLVGPNLTDAYWLHGCTAAELVANVKTGFPAKGMLPFGTGQKLTDEQVLQVVSYVLSKRGSNPANPKPIETERDQLCK
ncbi:MAG: cbb3-type cytochrome c oxidase N-terminal domain-containing protein [Acidobacteriota bacterium]